MKRTFAIAVATALAGTLAFSGGVLAKGKPCPQPPCNSEGDTATNNLSFPVIAVDDFRITPLQGDPSFTVPYTGEYPGLTEEQILALQASDAWYPQKTDGNKWQAEFDESNTEVDVTCVDWSDSIESVDPKVRRPFRMEVVLFKKLEEEQTMTAYTMAELEYPSSLDELQGTNTVTYGSSYATVVSAQPGLVIQYLGETLPEEDPTWNSTAKKWDEYRIDPVTFGVELNVAGKYIFGAAQGGWKPVDTGYYRATFYTRDGSGVHMTSAFVGNFADGECSPPIAESEAEGGGATPQIDAVNNLSYVDMHVVAGGGGGKGKPDR